MTSSAKKGWLGLCPIYFTPNPGGDCDVDARHWTLELWLRINVYAFLAWFHIHAMFSDAPQSWPILITGDCNDR